MAALEHPSQKGLQGQLEGWGKCTWWVWALTILTIPAFFFPSPNSPRMSSALVKIPKFFLFGDSITEQSFRVDTRGWGAQLTAHFERRVDVLNRGHPTLQALKKLLNLIIWLPICPPLQAFLATTAGGRR